jgi:aspartate/tyrosine/aromatic aminotransferase
MVDSDAFLCAVKALPRNSILLLQDAAHDPTGLDLSFPEWMQLQDIAARNQHLVIFDSSGVGTASGKVGSDVGPLRLFVEQENRMIVCTGFSKSMQLFNERVGSLHIFCQSAHETNRVQGLISNMLLHRNVHNPLHGARLVSCILNSDELRQEWADELREYMDQVAVTRARFVRRLGEFGTPHDWHHILRQTGLYAYTCLHPATIDNLITKHGIYLPMDGRIYLPAIKTE